MDARYRAGIYTQVSYEKRVASHDRKRGDCSILVPTHVNEAGDLILPLLVDTIQKGKKHHYW